MIVIKKGSKRLKVTKSAYKNFYKNAGWKKVSDTETKVTNEVPVEATEDLTEPSTEDAEVIEDDDEDWDEEDEEPSKPLSEMNRAELEEFAGKLGVSLAGLSTNKQIREAIKAAM